MIDTHCHLYKEYYDNLNELIIELKEKNITIINNGCNKESNNEVLELSKKYNNVYAAIGYHPEDIDVIKDTNLEELESNINNVVAIGEIGLDYHYRSDNKKEQIALFEKELTLATKYNKPVIIHNRDATEDTYSILKKYKLKGSIHAFSGSYEMAVNYIKLGYKIGIGGVLTFKNSRLKDIIKQLDIHDIVLETDSPYLSPEPERGKINTPLKLKYVVELISEIKNISCEEVCNITSATSRELFDLKP